MMKYEWASLVLSCALIGLDTAPAHGQAAAKTFEVASVKPNRSGSTQTTIEVQPTMLRLLNLQLRPIIQLAWDINTPSRLAGIPDWAEAERFDIIARADSIGSREAMRPMLQALLAERFKLAAHLEMRQRPIYALVRSRRDGALGAGLRVSTVTCAGRGAPPPSDGAPPAVPCGPRPGGAGRLILIGTPMQQFGAILSIMVGRPVVDMTGLTERYDLEITFTPDRPVPSPDGAPTPATPESGPSLFTALQEQLGLKLQPETEAVEMLAVEHIERPTEN
jgi:uncharacterized protein (TIGR03435 family)